MLEFHAFYAHNMAIKEKNYWLETLTTPPAQSARELPDSVDVAVVGAGFCGLSAARTLAKRGVNVAVFEAETFGWGASSRNGGMVLTGMKLPAPTLITSGATMTYSSPAWPHGIRNGLAKSGRVLRNCQDASTVRMVTPMRSQTYTVKSCTIVFCASSA